MYRTWPEIEGKSNYESAKANGYSGVGGSTSKLFLKFLNKPKS
jgi:hypothetical protein